MTPAAIRVVDVPGTGPQLLGNLRQVDALPSSTARRRDPGRRSRRFSSSCSSPTATTSSAGSSAFASRRSPAIRSCGRRSRELEKLLAHVEAGGPLADYGEELPPELEPLTTKPIMLVENGAGRDRPALEAELAELPEEEAAAFRDGGRSALDEVVQRLKEALDLVRFFTAGDKETRAWTLRRGQTALDAAGTIHTDIARGFIRCEVIRWNDFVECGSHAEVAKRGLQRLEGKDYVVEDGDVLNIRFNV